MNTPQGLLGWNRLIVSSDVNAYDPGIVNSEYYRGEATNIELSLGQSLFSIIENKWWQGSIAPCFDRLILKAVDAEGATLLYSDKEIRIGVNETKRIATAPLSYADSNLFVGIKKVYGDNQITTRFDVFSMEEYEQILHDAEAGDAAAMNRLAYIRFYGIPRLGLKANNKEGIRLWEKAAEAGDAAALNYMGYDYFYGDDEVKVDKVKGLDYLMRAAEAGNAMACDHLGDIYVQGGTGVVEQDMEKAFEYYQRAAVEQVQGAVTVVGMMYYDGVGTEQDYEKAFEMFKQTAKSESKWARGNSCYYLGEIYRMGLAGVEKDLKKAFNHYNIAAETKIPEAICQLGVMYSMGWGCEMNMKVAKEYWEEALDMNNAAAAHYLAMFYDDKKYGNNPRKANQYQKRAAELGDEDAKYEIEHGLRPGDRLKDEEQEIPEDGYTAEDWAQRLEATMDNPD